MIDEIPGDSPGHGGTNALHRAASRTESHRIASKDLTPCPALDEVDPHKVTRPTRRVAVWVGGSVHGGPERW